MRLQLEHDLFSEIQPLAARRLLLAAMESFASHGYHATTTRDIAARADLSPAAVYIHFSSKTELLREIIRLGHESALHAFERGFRETADPAARIATAVRDFTLWHARNRVLARVVQYELEALPPQERGEIEALRTRFEGMLRSEIERGIEAGVFTVAQVPGTATAIFSLCIDVARWYSPQRRRTAEQIGQLYADLALRMVEADADVRRHALEQAHPTG